MPGERTQDMTPIEYELLDDRARIRMDNPSLRNALTLEAARSLTEAIESVADSGARCVVLEGTGEAFCAGGDIQLMMEGLSGDRETDELMTEAAYPINRTVKRLYECPLPTVAKVDGPAFGAGASLAIACDVVLASERAELSFGFRRVGLSVDSGTSYLLPRMVGESTAKTLVYSGEVLTAEEAADLGLVNRVYPTEEFDERTAAFVDRVATGPTVALTRSKALLQRGLERSFEEAIDAEIEALGAVFETEDFSEGVEAFLEKRTPEFDGR